MAEYIEREALVAHLQNDLRKMEKSHLEKTYTYHCVKVFVKKLNDQPAVDVVEVRHGKWVDNGERDSRGVPKPFAISCSVCGSSAGNSWMRYCPNCGAKMDGKGD